MIFSPAYSLSERHRTNLRTGPLHYVHSGRYETDVRNSRKAEVFRNANRQIWHSFAMIGGATLHLSLHGNFGEKAYVRQKTESRRRDTNRTFFCPS